MIFRLRLLRVLVLSGLWLIIWLGLKLRRINGERIVDVVYHGLRQVEVFRVGKFLDDPMGKERSVYLRATVDHVPVVEDVKDQGKPSWIRHII